MCITGGSSLFCAELAHLGLLHGLAVVDAAELAAHVADGVGLAGHHVLLAHLELDARVLLHVLVHLPFGVGRRQQGRVNSLADVHSVHLLAGLLLLVDLRRNGEVGVLQSLLGGHSLKGTLFQHPLQQVHSVLSDLVLVVLGEVDVAGSVLAQDLVVGGPGEGRSAEQKQMENQTQTEQIADRLILGLHVLDVDHFGGHVAGGTAPDEQILADGGELGQTEVGDDAVEVSLLPEEQVFGFQVSMHDVFRVHFPQAEKDASDDELGLVGFEFVLSLPFSIKITLILSYS